jgi:ubiquinone biosynthesis protein Coq4
MMTLEVSDEIATRYENLQQYPAASLGRGLWDFYKKRNFTFPGVIGGINEAVAHHDWIHVLADYDSDGIGEIEVAAFSTMATESESAVMNFLGVLSIFQGGLLKTIVAGAPHLGHDMEVTNGLERVSTALKRGKEVAIDLVLGINYFDYAHEPLEELRKRWNIPSK